MFSAIDQGLAVAVPLSDDRALLVHHVARMCGISPRTVRWAAQRGLLSGFREPKTPKLWRFRRADVIAYKARRHQCAFQRPPEKEDGQ